MKWIFFTPVKKPPYMTLVVMLAELGDALVRLFSLGLLATRWPLWAREKSAKLEVARKRKAYEQSKLGN